MNARKILIANNKTQQRYEIMSDATTLGELQDQMTAQGIDFQGMSFTEGISKTQLLNRESLLPTNVMYKGQPTNDLVMLLTNTTKQIASGAGEYNRKDLYAKIKAYGLENTVKTRCGKNYTMVGNADLASIINDVVVGNRQEAIEEVRKELSNKPEVKPAAAKTVHQDFVEVLYLGVKYMVNHNLLYIDDAAALGDLISELAARKKEEQPKISDAEIDEMFDSL